MRRWTAVAMVILGACGSDPAPAPVGPLAVGESRAVVLRATRFDVRAFEKTLVRADLLSLPRPLRERMWMLDLDLSGNATDPQLFDHALDRIRALDPDDPALGQAERNMVRLLNMTPATADLTGTAMEPLLDLSAKIGFGPADLLADAMGVGVDEPFLSTGQIKAAMLEQVVATHPNARSRPGPVTPEHPDGRWPVPPGHLPVTLEDALTDMHTLAARYGPTPGDPHPGFLVGATAAPLLGDDFAITVRANLNALPFKGVDLETASVASVNSIGAEPDGIFDTSDAEWLRMTGFASESPAVSLTFALVESPRRVSPGASPLPWPTGDSGLWAEPPWCIERVVAGAAVARWGDRDYERALLLGPDPDPVATLRIDDGWFQATTKADLGDPPPPMYLWDLLADVAQERLHDGGLAEGEAQVAFTLEDVPVGPNAAQIEAQVRESLAADPAALVSAARVLFDNGSGEPDLYYVRAPGATDPALAGDWLFFVDSSDSPQGADGEPIRPGETWARPGFFAGPNLAEDDRLSAPTPVAGDLDHQKVRVSAGDVLYVRDEGDRTFRLDVGPKPGALSLSLTVTRVD